MLNEIIISEKKLNYPKFTNRLILLLPILLIIKGKRNLIYFNNSIHKRNLVLDNLNNIKPKIQLLKKIGPYLSEPQVNILNKIIILFEKINRTVSLIDFLSKDNNYKPIVINNITSKKERFNGILKVLEDELPKETTKIISPIIEIAANFEKYKGILSTLTNLIGSNGNSELNFDNLISSFSSILSDKDESNIKDISKMLEILNVLNSPINEEDQSK